MTHPGYQITPRPDGKFALIRCDDGEMPLYLHSVHDTEQIAERAARARRGNPERWRDEETVVGMRLAHAGGGEVGDE